MAAEYLCGYDSILDPFGGIGRVHDLSIHFQKHHTVALDIEPEWAAMAGMKANACRLPFPDGVFDGIFTSPVYGNRMSDHHKATDASKRNTYTHVLGHDLHEDNAGRMHFGTSAYESLHLTAWAEAVRVLRPGGRFVLNTKDFIRKGNLVHVTDWHVIVLQNIGLRWTVELTVPTPGNRFGANGLARVESEDVTVFDKP